MKQVVIVIKIKNNQGKKESILEQRMLNILQKGRKKPQIWHQKTMAISLY